MVADAAESEALMNANQSIPPPADEPDDGCNPTFSPEEFPATVGGEIVARTTHKFSKPRGERTTFEKLVLEQPRVGRCALRPSAFGALDREAQPEGG